MSKRLLLASIGVAAFGLAASAQAETLLFSYSETGGYNFTFEQSSNPTPNSYIPDLGTNVPVTDATGDLGSFSSVDWYNADDSGMFDVPGTSFSAYGPQVYTGGEADPVFAPGVFVGVDQTNSLTGTLTITAVSGVPEPAAWALMLIGFGALGAGLRARKTALTSA